VQQKLNEPQLLKNAYKCKMHKISTISEDVYDQICKYSDINMVEKLICIRQEKLTTAM